jgi:hypothetical protein
MPHSSGVPELPPRFCGCLQPVATLVSRNSVLGIQSQVTTQVSKVSMKHAATESQTSGGEQAEGLSRRMQSEELPHSATAAAASIEQRLQGADCLCLTGTGNSQRSCMYMAHRR